MGAKLKFVLRVAVIHIITYVICGMVFSMLFNYAELFQFGNAKYFMRPLYSSSSLIGPAIQILRGLLFGVVLLLVKESIIETKHGWLKLWAILAVIGIINTPAAAPFSIEGLVYTQLPLEFHIKGAPEVLVQTLFFSVLVANPIKIKDSRFFKANRTPLVSAALAGVMFSISGVVLALIYKVDIMAESTDVGALIVMFLAIVAVFFVSKWYGATAFQPKHIILLACAYIVLAVAPTAYNYFTGSTLASWLTLLINIVPTIIVFLINYFAKNSAE